MTLPRTNAARAAVLGIAAALTVSACTASSGHDHHAATTTSGSTITISDYGYTVPKTVRTGQKITIHNEDKVAHTVTSAAKPGFNSKVGANATATFTAPSKAGSYAFICTYHPYMKATLVVK